MSKKKCFITGSTGFIGMNIVSLLMNECVFNEVHCFHRPKSSLKPALEKLTLSYEGEEVKFILCQGDVTDIDSIREAMPEGTDCVFHLAGAVDYFSRNKDHLMDINYGGTMNVAKVCREKGVKRIIHCGSTAAYGRSALPGPDGKEPMLSEKSPKLGKEAKIMYWKTKGLADEHMCSLMEEMDIVTINPPKIMGKFDTNSLFRFFNLIKTNSLPGIPVGNTPYSDVEEVAKCFVNAYKVAEPGSEYLLGGVKISTLGLFQEICKELDIVPRYTKESLVWVAKIVGVLYDFWGKVTKKTFTVSSETIFLTRMKYDVDCSKAEKELGFVKTPIGEMVKKAAEYFRENQWKVKEDKDNKI